MPVRNGVPPLGAPTTFRDDEIRVAEALIQSQLRRTLLVSNVTQTEAFRSFMAKFILLRKKVDAAKLKRARAKFAQNQPNQPSETEAPSETGDLGGVSLSLVGTPRESPRGDPEPGHRARHRLATPSKEGPPDTVDDETTEESTTDDDTDDF